MQQHEQQLDFFLEIPEQTQDNPEKAIQEFRHSALKLLQDAINNITFHGVHHIGARNNTNRPRPIIAKFKRYKQKEFV